MRAMGDAMRLGTYVGIQLLRPFIELTKSEIAVTGQKLVVDFAQTWSCYKGGAVHCGTCGTCGKDDQICVESEGACRTFAFCDHDRPVCKTACASTQFCGTDCQCHRLRDDLPDLIVDRDVLLRDLHVTESAART